MKPKCKDCNCFRVENPEPVFFELNKTPVYNGRCDCHGYYIQSNEEACIDYEQR